MWGETTASDILTSVTALLYRAPTHYAWCNIWSKMSPTGLNDAMPCWLCGLRRSYMHIVLLITRSPAAILFAQSASLTVVQGSARRSPTAGALAHVWADPNAATQVFDGWAGDVQYLLDPAAWRTTSDPVELIFDFHGTRGTGPPCSLERNTWPSFGK